MRLQLLGASCLAALAAVALVAACGPDSELLQGDPFAPDGRLAVAEPSARDDAGDGSSADAGSDAAPGVPTPGSDGGNAPTNTCATARALGTVSGDTGGGTVTATGTCSEWLSIRVSEDDGSTLGVPMRVSLTLAPRGADFDLYAYLDKDADRLSCTAPAVVAASPGLAPETATLSWGEGSVANGGDDARTVTIAVVRASGSCDGDAGSFALTARGNP